MCHRAVTCKTLGALTKVKAVAMLLYTRCIKPKGLNTILPSSFHLSRCFATEISIQTDEIYDLVDAKPPKTKLPQKSPFAKNLFLGKTDNDLFAYPEALNNEELAALTTSLEQLKQYFNKIESYEYSLASDEVFSKLKNLGLFGLSTSSTFLGKNLCSTEICKYMEEIAHSPTLLSCLNVHNNVVTTCLSKKGTDEQKKQLLPNMCSGTTITALGLIEEDIIEQLNAKTNAVFSKDGNSLVLNGTKSWVLNATFSNTYLIFCNVPQRDKLGNEVDELTAVIVERDRKGVTIEPFEEIFCSRAGIANVHFLDTLIPKENIIGSIGEGAEVVRSFVTEYRLSAGPTAITLLKKMLKHLIDWSTRPAEASQIHLFKTEVLKEKACQIATDIYVLESMTYFTAALIDLYQDQDCEMEATIVKSYAVDAVHKAFLSCLPLFGASMVIKDKSLKKMIEDTVYLMVFNENAGTIKLNIALSGLQHVGLSLADEVKMLRNPAFNPGVVFKKLFAQRRHGMDNPKLKHEIENYLHPWLTETARLIEYSISRLQFGSETMLMQHGPVVLTKHMQLRRLGEAAVDTFAMIAVAGRASRSYCIGLRNADHEVLTACSFCSDARTRVKANIQHIYDGESGTNDGNNGKIGQLILNSKKYCFEHPLNKNY